MGIFLLISAITALSVYAIEQVETQRAEAQHRQFAIAVSSAIERLANANAAYLRAGAALLSTQEDERPQAFHEFAVQIGNDDSLRGGGALGWAVLTPRNEVPALEKRMRLAGIPGFTVNPRTWGPQTLPVIRVEPNNSGTVRSYGFDFFAEPARRAAVERAIRTGAPTASGPIQLISDPRSTRRAGFGIFMPIYNGTDGGRKLRGVIARAFDAQSFVNAALSPEQLANYGVTLIDGESPAGTAMATAGDGSGQGEVLLRPLTIANRRMLLQIRPPASATLSSLSLLTLLFGMMVAALLLVVARLVTQQAAEDRAALAWFEEQASIRNSLTRELNHRVKNTLANVLSIVALTRRRTNNVDDFVNGLIGRVRALSATHDLLTQSEWGTTPIRAVVDAELAPYVHGGEGAVEMRGPNVELAPNDALSFGLAIHELATNASKYGALSTTDGRVDIWWEMITDKLARVEWSEHGGPPVPEQRRRGFGTELIEKIVAHELKNPVDLRFDAHGVRCTLIVPIRAPVTFQIRAIREAEAL